MKRWPILPAALSTLVATACTGQPEPPTVVQQSPSMVELRWFNDRANLDQATMVAERRCTEFGKQPGFNSISMDEDVSLATFRCQQTPSTETATPAVASNMAEI